MLKVKNLEVVYGKINAVKGVCFEVNKGSIVVLLGANGAGKSSVVKAIAGLAPAVRGCIEYNGTRIDRYEAAQIVRLGISQVPEGRSVFPELTVRENLDMGAYTRKGRQEVKEDMDIVFEYFPILGKRSSQKAGNLSGGEQQMLAIARALMARPNLLLLDEPSFGLAPLVVEQIFGILKRINDEGTTILLVEQNVDLALALANYGYVLEVGKIVLEGRGKELASSTFIKDSYLGG